MAQIRPPTSAMQPVLRALRLPAFGIGTKLAALVLAAIVVADAAGRLDRAA